ncbi:MAG: site-specific integrase [Planctomycetes bacterium]|nr:site-specific integrase [Planctomycetota bacterium]
MNSHRQDAVAFMEWCRKTGRVRENRLGIVPARDQDRDRKRVRRPLTDDELARLLEVAAPRGRRPLYAAAAYAGLRRGDLQRLRWGDVDLEAGTLTIADGKAKRVDTLPLHPLLGPELAAVRPEKPLPAARVFSTVPTDLTRRHDFERAGIPLVDEDGRYADLHSLRGWLAMSLARAGVAPQIAQRIMRHADYRTTLKHYTVLSVQDAAGALSRLLPLGDSRTEAARATGTGGAVPGGSLKAAPSGARNGVFRRQRAAKTRRKTTSRQWARRGDGGATNF